MSSIVPGVILRTGCLSVNFTWNFIKSDECYINCYTLRWDFFFSVMCQSSSPFPPLSPTQRSMEYGVTCEEGIGKIHWQCGLRDRSVRIIFISIILILIFTTAAQLMQHFALVALPAPPAVWVLLLPVTCIHETEISHWMTARTVMRDQRMERCCYQNDYSKQSMLSL